MNWAMIRICGAAARCASRVGVGLWEVLLGSQRERAGYHAGPGGATRPAGLYPQDGPPPAGLFHRSPVQALELVIFAALAAVVLFQLYAVLGRRVGRQPEDAAEVEARRPAAELEARRPDEAHAPEAATGIAALRARSRGFDPHPSWPGPARPTRWW